MSGAKPVIRKVTGLIAVAAAVLALPVAVGGSGPVWQPLPDAPQPERQEVSYVALDGFVYLAAGKSRNQDRYNPATEQWTSVASLPADFEGVDHLHGVAAGGKIIYIGGLEQWEQPFPVIGTVAVYDPDTNEFEEGKEMPSPRAAGGVAAWRGNVIYAGGLGPDGSVARVDAYDPETDTWTELSAMPQPRDHFQAAVVGNELYAIGGRETSETGDVEEIAAVDVLDLPAEVSGLPTANWREDVTTLPTPRGGHGVATVGECVYAIGGEGIFGEGTDVTGATEAYDTGEDTWYQLEPLRTPRHGIQAAVVGATIFVAAGGIEAFEYEPTAVHEALDVSGREQCDPPGQEPPPGNGPRSGGPTAPASNQPTGKAQLASIERLAVSPRQLRLQKGRRARFTVVLTLPGEVLLRVQQARSNGRWAQRWRRVLALPAGHNVVDFSGKIAGKPLPPGRYRLFAQLLGQVPPGSDSRAFFRIVD